MKKEKLLKEECLICDEIRKKCWETDQFHSFEIECCICKGKFFAFQRNSYYGVSSSPVKCISCGHQIDLSQPPRKKLFGFL